jgi:hypothetical protein
LAFPLNSSLLLRCQTLWVDARTMLGAACRVGIVQRSLKVRSCTWETFCIDFGVVWSIFQCPTPSHNDYTLMI